MLVICSMNYSKNVRKSLITVLGGIIIFILLVRKLRFKKVEVTYDLDQGGHPPSPHHTHPSALFLQEGSGTGQ